MIVIGDVHGCYKTLMALVAQFPKDQPIAFAGDLIDRGPGSKEVIEFVKSNGHHCVMGNHEDMLVRAAENGDINGWLRNGGIQTLQSYDTNVDPGKISISQEHLEWVKKLPLYLHFPDIKNEKGRALWVAHTGLQKKWQNAVKELEHNLLAREQFMWQRRTPMSNTNSDIYQIFGHTPTPQPIITDYFANVDTGACFGGKLTGLQFPEMITYQQQMID